MKLVEPIRDIKIIKTLRAVLKSQSTRNELLFILGINVGLRVSDILNLKFDDILMPNLKSKDTVTISERKTNKTKKFYIGKEVKSIINRYVTELETIDMDGFVFKSRQGDKPISRQQCWNILNGAAELVGLVKKDGNGRIVSGEVGTHTLRKTFGYHAYKNGVSLELLQDIFNHTSQSITLRYIGITEDNKKDVYLNLNLG